MLSIGFFEILIIAVLGLLVFGPEKLPDAIRTFAFGFSKVKRSWNNTRRELEQELGMDEIRREIHNAQVIENLDRLKNKTGTSVKEITKGVEESIALSKDAAADTSASDHKSQGSASDSSDSADTESPNDSDKA